MTMNSWGREGGRRKERERELKSTVKIQVDWLKNETNEGSFRVMPLCMLQNVYIILLGISQISAAKILHNKPKFQWLTTLSFLYLFTALRVNWGVPAAADWRREQADSRSAPHVSAFCLGQRLFEICSSNGKSTKEQGESSKAFEGHWGISFTNITLAKASPWPNQHH